MFKEDYAKAWKYFIEFYSSDYISYHPEFKDIDFEKLPFEMQFGVFIAFFNSINIDVDFYSNEMSALEESIKESFCTYEEYLFLDS